MTFSGNLREDGEFPRWFASHRPPHTHIWRYSHGGFLPDRNFFGLPLTLYMMKLHPIYFLTTDEEMEFVKHADEATLKQFSVEAAAQDLKSQFRAFDTAKKRLSEMK